MRSGTKLNKPIRTVGLIYRSEGLKAKQLTIQLLAWLHEKKIETHSAQPLVKYKLKATTPALLKKTDLVIVLGGDGTYLRAVQWVEGQSIPILGFNVGSLGFLTENRVEDLYPVLELTFAGRMELCPRSMLNVSLLNGKKRKDFYALNDAVIERGNSPALLNLSLTCGKDLVTETKADGVIIASPTGSTAYNLAAGGPILHPMVHAIVVTPICPHSLTTRPLIFPDDEELKFKIVQTSRKAVLTLDGQKSVPFTHQDEVIIKRDRQCHFVFRRPGQNYFGLLREKLKFGDRA